MSSLYDEEDHVTKNVRNREGTVFEKDAGTTVNPSFRHALVGQVMEDKMEEDKDTESEPNLDEMEDYRLNLATKPPNICFAEKIHTEINARLDMTLFVRLWVETLDIRQNMEGFRQCGTQKVGEK
ncbi:hypothetical protein Syun_029415 [Stephania yunnanensis]|uniref:Uncharacterized protein n=1 Tax=Stephania yunnanensis TaxID=152371 RepID=A0AAP0E5K3_9MAGN